MFRKQKLLPTKDYSPRPTKKARKKRALKPIKSQSWITDDSEIEVPREADPDLEFWYEGNFSLNPEPPLQSTALDSMANGNSDEVLQPTSRISPPRAAKPVVNKSESLGRNVSNKIKRTEISKSIEKENNTKSPQRKASTTRITGHNLKRKRLIVSYSSSSSQHTIHDQPDKRSTIQTELHKNSRFDKEPERRFKSDIELNEKSILEKELDKRSTLKEEQEINLQQLFRPSEDEAQPNIEPLLVSDDSSSTLAEVIEINDSSSTLPEVIEISEASVTASVTESVVKDHSKTSVTESVVTEMTQAGIAHSMNQHYSENNAEEEIEETQQKKIKELTYSVKCKPSKTDQVDQSSSKVNIKEQFMEFKQTRIKSRKLDYSCQSQKSLPSNEISFRAITEYFSNTPCLYKSHIQEIQGLQTKTKNADKKSKTSETIPSFPRSSKDQNCDQLYMTSTNNKITQESVKQRKSMQTANARKIKSQKQKTSNNKNQPHLSMDFDESNTKINLDKTNKEKTLYSTYIVEGDLDNTNEKTAKTTKEKSGPKNLSSENYETNLTQCTKDLKDSCKDRKMREISKNAPGKEIDFNKHSASTSMQNDCVDNRNSTEKSINVEVKLTNTEQENHRNVDLENIISSDDDITFVEQSAVKTQSTSTQTKILCAACKNCRCPPRDWLYFQISTVIPGVKLSKKPAKLCL